MKKQFSVTFERITEESCEVGEAEEQGFEFEQCTLSEALNFLRWNGNGYIEADEWPHQCPRWFTWYGDRDMRSGDVVNYSLHIPNSVTPSSRRRIARLIGCSR